MSEATDVGCPLCGYTAVRVERSWGTCPNGCPTRDSHPELDQTAKARGQLIHEVARETCRLAEPTDPVHSSSIDDS